MAIRFYETLDSTNAEAWRLIANNDINDGDVVVARAQSAGVGQRGRSWASTSGGGLYASIALTGKRLIIQPAILFFLNMAVAIAARGTILKLLEPLFDEKKRVDIETSLRIKWPNDIYIRPLGAKNQDFFKACGVLVETSLQGNEVTAAVIGVGINLTQTDWPAELPNAISLWQALDLQPHDQQFAKAGYSLQPEAAAEVLEASWKEVYQELQATPNTILEHYNELLWRRDQRAWFVVRSSLDGDQASEQQGIIEGVDKEGRLLVSFDGKTPQAFQHGEIAFADLVSA